jgi:hypothetical protein
MVRFRPALATAAAVALSTALAACGSSDSKTSSAPPPEPAPSAAAASFPSAKGKTLQDLERGLTEGPNFAPSVSVLNKGTNRFGFALFDDARKQISGAPVAMYVSKADGSELSGPFVARAESLEVSPQFLSKTSSSDPDAAKSIYVSDVKFPGKGKYTVTALARLNDKLVTTTTYEVAVGAKGAQPPQVGEKAPVIDTLTPADVGGDLSQLDTRIPPAKELNQVNAKDVIGKKPVVLLFGTPQLCQSRVCGPVEDIVLEEQAKGHPGVDFIHQEIYNDNEIQKGFRKQVGQYRLPSEPWVFVIDDKGVVQARLEGAFSAGELARAIAKVEKS